MAIAVPFSNFAFFYTVYFEQQSRVINSVGKLRKPSLIFAGPNNSNLALLVAAPTTLKQDVSPSHGHQFFRLTDVGKEFPHICKSRTQSYFWTLGTAKHQGHIGWHNLASNYLSYAFLISLLFLCNLAAPALQPTPPQITEDGFPFAHTFYSAREITCLAQCRVGSRSHLRCWVLPALLDVFRSFSQLNLYLPRVYALSMQLWSRLLGFCFI